VTAWYFGREMRHEDPMVRSYAGMGLTLCLGYFILGLVDVMLMWGVSDNFYAMLCALLFTCIMTRKQALEAAKMETAELSAAAM
jgi:O-antigen ligase